MTPDTYRHFASPADVRAATHLVDLMSISREDAGPRLFEATRGATAALALMLSNAVTSLAALDPDLTSGMILHQLEEGAVQLLRSLAEAEEKA